MEPPLNAKITIALAVILVALAAAYFLTGDAAQSGGATGTPGVETPQLVPYTTDQVTRIGVRTAGDSVTLLKDAMGTWGYGRGSAPPTSPADQTRVSGLAARLAGLKAQGKVTDTSTDAQKAEYGLSQPDAEITVGSQTDTLILTVGAQNPRRTGYYAQIAGTPPVYLMEAALVDDIKRLSSQPPDPPTPTPSPTGTSNTSPAATPKAP